MRTIAVGPRADFSGLNDLGALRRFISVCDYLLDNSNSDDDGYVLTWPQRRRVEVVHGADTS
jgi:hypothetical protein